MKQVSGRSLSLPVGIFLCISTFEFQSESNAIMFRISWLILHLLVWCMKNCKYIKRSAKLGSTYYQVF